MLTKIPNQVCTDGMYINVILVVDTRFNSRKVERGGSRTYRDLKDGQAQESNACNKQTVNKTTHIYLPRIEYMTI